MSVVVEGLDAGFGRRRVLHDISLNVESGQVVSIVGPNGAGKTTLLRCIGGLLEPQRGQIRVAGRRIAGLQPQQRARLIAYVPQAEPSRFPITVFDTVLLGRRPYFGWRPGPTDIRTAAQAIHVVDLDDLAHRPMDELSGGERQRVAIARAIAQEPDVLVLDEPTTYLDLHHQLLALEMVTGLAPTRGTTVVMTMHDLNLAVRFSDTVVVLDRGNIAASGSPEVLDRRLLREVYGVECAITTVDGRPTITPIARVLTSPGFDHIPG